MTEYRLKPSEFAMADAMPFQQHFEARVDRPISDAVGPEFFLSVKNSLRPGDQVTVCAYLSKEYKRLAELAVYRISDVTEKNVNFVQVGETFSVSGAAPALKGEMKPKRWKSGQYIILKPDETPVPDEETGEARIFPNKAAADAFIEAA